MHIGETAFTYPDLGMTLQSFAQDIAPSFDYQTAYTFYQSHVDCGLSYILT
jgi:hypothetical protein